MQPEPAIAIIGPGRLGMSLGAALLNARYRLRYVASRNLDDATAVAQKLRRRVKAVTPTQAAAEADVVFLTVPDNAIESVAQSLAWREGQFVVHCSGALGLDVLAAATAADALAGCFHPIQSFPSREAGGSVFHNISVGIEATPPLDEFLGTLALDLRCTTVDLEGVDRALYHAASVFAGNDIVALVTAAVRTWELAGLPAALAKPAFAPLLITAGVNAITLDPVAALTGPVARGDTATVERHLAALESEPDLRELYATLARELTRLDLGHSPETRARFAGLLGHAPDQAKEG